MSLTRVKIVESAESSSKRRITNANVCMRLEAKIVKVS